MKAQAVVLNEKHDLTDAQLYALFRSVEAHYMRIGENVAGQEKRAIRLRGASFGTVTALIRKQYVENKEATDDWGRKRTQGLLTKKAIRVGISEFERVRGKTPMKMAEEMQAASKKAREKRRAEVDKIANLFIGLTIGDKSGKTVPMEKFIHDRLWGGTRPVSEGGVELNVKQLKKLGQQIQELMP